MVLSVTLFAFDRLLVLNKVARYLSLSKSKLRLGILFSWCVSLSLSLPLIVGLKSMPYRQRYSCTVSDPRDDVYMAVAFTAIIAVPAVILLVIGISTVLIFHREKKKQKKIKGQSYSYLDQILMIPYYRNELYPSVCMLALSTLCLVLWLPYGALTTLDPLLTTHWFNRTFDESHEFQDHYIEMDHHVGNDYQFGNRSSQDMTEFSAENTTNHIHLIPEMVDTAAYETVFIWFRFAFDFLIPVVILITLKELRHKCRALVLCCRPSSVEDFSPSRTLFQVRGKTPKSTGFVDVRLPSKKANKEKVQMVSFHTPVLFATGEGLLIRTVESPCTQIPFRRNESTAPKFSYEVCDIVSGQQNLSDLENLYLEDEHYSEDLVSTSVRGTTGTGRSQQKEHGHLSKLMAEDADGNDTFVVKQPMRIPGTSATQVGEINRKSTGKSHKDVVNEVLQIDQKESHKKVVRFDSNLNVEISCSGPNVKEESYSSPQPVGNQCSGILQRNREKEMALKYPQNRPKNAVSQRSKEVRPFLQGRNDTRFGRQREKRKINKEQQRTPTYQLGKVKKIRSRYMDLFSARADMNKRGSSRVHRVNLPKNGKKDIRKVENTKDNGINKTSVVRSNLLEKRINKMRNGTINNGRWVS